MPLLLDRASWATRLAEVSQSPHANESELRHALYTVLHPYCTQVVGMEPGQLRHEGSGASGRFDSLLGSVLVEYKTPGELETRSRRRVHAAQALRYLADERIGASVVLLTDGRYWGILRDPGVTDQPQVTLDDSLFPDLSPEEHFQWRRTSEATALRILDLLDTLRFDPVTPTALMNRLGPTTLQGRLALAEIGAAVNGRTAGQRTDILFRQWLALAGVSYGIGEDDSQWPKDRDATLGQLAAVIPDIGYAETIFTLHTYVALCSKLIAAEALALSRGSADQRPSQWASLSDAAFQVQLDRLESGQLADAMRAPRLMGGDLFGWYADVARDNTGLRGAVRGLVSSFSQLAWARLTHATRVSSDLLREFYMGIIPRQLRKGLGEFFTPEWIAEGMVERALALGGHEDASCVRFLDPTCGSGTFLVAAMRRTIDAARAKGLDERAVAEVAVASVTGFDVNPVSPLMARVNLLLVLAELADELPEVLLNVFQADSILIPEPPRGVVRLDQVEAAITIPLVIGDVSLPPSLATLPAIAGLARTADNSIQRGRDTATFRARLKAELPSMGVAPAEEEGALAAAEELYGVLSRLHVEGKNGVWAHVIEQSFAPKVLEPVDIVVGNPPWISWKNLPSEWRERSEPTWRRWGLWQSKRRGGGTPMADISSLLLARSVATYCPKGIVALLLPDGVMLNEPGGRSIRRCNLNSDVERGGVFRPLHVDDFSTLKPFSDAANRPVALYVRGGEEPTFPFPGTEWSRSQSRASLQTHMSLAAAQRVLSAADVEYMPVSPSDPASKWRPVIAGRVDASGTPSGLPYVWGQGFHTRGADGIYFCDVLSETPYPGGLVRVRTRPDLGRNTRDLEPTEGLVEARFVWPLLRGANVDPFNARGSGLYCLVPHNPDRLTQVLSRADALEAAPHLYDLLEPHLERLQSRSAYDMKLDRDHPWGIQGTAWRHMRRDRILVVCRYMESQKRPPAAVVAPVDDPRLGLRTTRYPNNKVNFLACLSLLEADYVAAFLNSDPVQATIAQRSSSTTIAPATLNALYLPRFTPSDELHRAISAVGEEARLSPGSAWPALRDHLNELVEQLLQQRD